MWATYLPFYLCQRMRSVRQQRFFTLSQHQKKVVSDSFEVRLKVSTQLFLIFHFFRWLKLDLVKMAKLACDQLCQRTLRIRQQIACAHCAYGSTLLAHTAHTVYTLLAHTAHTVVLCQRALRMRQQNRVKLCSLQANAAHAVALFQRTLRLRQQIASVCLHTVAICKRMLRIRQQLAGVHCA